MWALVGSLLLTTIVVLQNDMPNDDGVLYMLSADLFAQGQWRDAFSLYPQAFYGALIALVHTLTGLDTEVSTYILNALFHALMVYAFIGLVAELGGDSKFAWLGALLILIYPQFNELRSEILRGFGYWAFFLSAILLLLRHARSGAASTLALATGSLLFVAALFRIEGVVLLGLLPLALLLDPVMPWRSRLRRCLAVYAVYLSLAMAALGALVLFGDRLGLPALGDFQIAYATRVIEAFSSEAAQKVGVLREGFLSRYSEEYAWPVYLASVLIIWIGDVVSSIGLPFALVAAYGIWASRDGAVSYPRRMLLFFIAVNLLILLLFVIDLGFLTSRYPMALALLMLVFVPPGLIALYRRYGPALQSRLPGAALNGLVALVLAYLLVDGLTSFSAGKAHHRQAAAWLRENASPAERVFSFDTPILYRAGKLRSVSDLKVAWTRVQADDLELVKLRTWSEILAEGEWRRFDYIVASISRKRPHEQVEIESAIGGPPLQTFENDAGDRVLIYATGT